MNDQRLKKKAKQLIMCQMLRSLKKFTTENKKISSIFDTESKEMKFYQ